MRDKEITIGNTWGITQSGKQDNKTQLIQIHKERLDYGKHREIEKAKLKELRKMTEQENTDSDRMSVILLIFHHKEIRVSLNLNHCVYNLYLSDEMYLTNIYFLALNFCLFDLRSMPCLATKMLLDHPCLSFNNRHSCIPSFGT